MSLRFFSSGQFVACHRGCVVHNLCRQISRCRVSALAEVGGECVDLEQEEKALERLSLGHMRKGGPEATSLLSAAS